MLYWYYKLYNKLFSNSKYIIYDNLYSIGLYKAHKIGPNWYFNKAFEGLKKANPNYMVEIK